MHTNTPTLSGIMAVPLDRTMRDGWRELVGKGQDAYDVTKEKRRPWCMALRPADRALALGRPKETVLAWYYALPGIVDAIYPGESRDSLLSASLAENDANHPLNAVQIKLSERCCPDLLLEAKRHGRAQIEATVRLCAAVDRELAKAGRSWR